MPLYNPGGGSGVVQWSAGTLSATRTDITFGDSNGVSFGLNANGVITGSVAAVGGAQTGISGIIVSDATYTSGTVSFSNAGNITIASSVNGATQYIRLSVAAQTNQSAIKGIGVSNTGNTAGNTGLSTGIDWVIAGSNGITASQSTAGGGPNTIWISGTIPAAQTNQTVGLYGLGNTTQNSSTTLDARTISLNGLGGITVGYSNGSVQISGPQTAAQTNQSVGLYALGNTTQNSSTTLDARTISLNGLGGITVGYSNGSVQISGPAAAAAQTNQTLGFYGVGNTQDNSSTTLDARTVSFKAFGSLTVGYSNGSIELSAPNAITTAMLSNAVTLSNINISAGTTSNLLSKLTFADSNGVSWGLNASTITASVLAQSNQTIGAYLVGTTSGASSTTVDARSLTLSGFGPLSLGASGGSVLISVAGALYQPLYAHLGGV